MSSMLGYFGFGSKASSQAQQSNTPSPVRALPRSWYTAPEMYEFERRAIFSRRWQFITSSSRIKEPGDWLRYNIAGFDIIITRDRSGSVNAFHNVCRHRAYPVVEGKDKGSAKIFSCRYHGWSYGLNGKLAKAPGYSNFSDFDKEQNGLFKIHTKVDGNGFIWINMDAKETPEVSWEEHFDNVDVQKRYATIDFTNYDLDHTYNIEADYNWKLASDNFNECYHCPTTHPDIPSFLNLDSFDSDVKDGHIQHHCDPTEEQEKAGLAVHSTYYFPNSSMSVSAHFMMIQKFLPTGPTTTKITYEIYRNRNSSESDFRLIADMYARVMSEDKALCNAAQKNISTGVFVNGQLHPKYEKAPLFFQSTVREVIYEHFKKEKEAGKEIWPARQALPDNAEVSLEDQEICEGLMCSPKQQEILAW
ncbi:oxidoreductase-like protein 7 [Elsinoe australis]|uniref:Choline monooxygenase, chloroplastic n=1 Tax=Elsinoe australis TaxID=40998 RepID=A0A4U7BA64_9PEZI|nr:oxidoreductase-like protein 7 [Elsinoe australis]